MNIDGALISATQPYNSMKAQFVFSASILYDLDCLFALPALQIDMVTEL